MHDWSLTVRVITLGTTWTRNTKYFNSFIGIIGIGMWPCMCGLTQSHAILCDPMGYSLPSSSVCGIFQARILEWAAISSSTRSSQPRDWTHVSCILAGRFFTTQPLGNCLCDLSSVQSLSHVWLFVTLWTAARQASLSITNSRSLLKLMSSKLMMPSNHLILCCPLLLLPSIFPSIKVFSSESVLCIRWPKNWSFSFTISPSNEYSGWISFRIDWLDIFAVQRDSQESSPTPHFKSIHSLALNLLYSVSSDMS